MAGPRVTREVRSLERVRVQGGLWHAGSRRQLVAALTNPNLQIVIAFCLIGVLLTLNVMLRFPDWGMLIEQYNQF